LIAWWQTSQPGFLIGAICDDRAVAVDVARYQAHQTIVAGDEPEKGRAADARLVSNGARSHAVPDALGVLATVAFLWACMSR